MDKNMKTEAIIRYAAPADAALITELAGETFHDAFAGHPLMPADDLNSYVEETFTVERMTLELQDPKALFLLAEISGEPAGYAKLVAGIRAAGIDSENPLKLQRIYARQKFLGAGIGQDLMNRCLLEAARGGHDSVWLSVWEHNLRAQAFYRKWRFETCGFIDFQLGKSTMRDFLMLRSI